jgi:predicted exporter
MTLPRSRKALVLIAWIGALAAALVVIVRSPFVADLSAFLPSNADETQQVLIDQLKAGTPARTLMVGLEGGDAEARADASRTLAASLRAGGHFEQVNNGEDDAWSGVGTWVFERRYQLSPAVTREHFEPAGLRAAIDETLSLLGTPAGAIVKPLLERDPTGETQRIAESLIPAQAPRTDRGVWVGREAPRAVLMLVTRAAGADLDGQSAALQAIRSGFEPLAARGLTLLVSGPPKFSVDSRAQIEREIHWLALAGTLLMGALLLVAFASPLALVAAFLPVGSGVIAGIAAVSLGFGSVHGVTLGFGATLIGEAVDYAIYYLIQARGHAAAAPGAGWRGWHASGWPTIRLGLLTSVCGFAALLFSGFPGLAQLGVFSITGLCAAAATARFVLPVLLPDGTRGIGWRPQLARTARAATRRLPRSRWLWVALGIGAAATIARHGELWDAELASLSPVPREAIELDTRLRADVTAGDAGGLVVVQGPDAETVLQRTEAATTQLEALVEQHVLAGLTSVTRLLPSQATQRSRLAALPEPAALRQALDAATQGGPLRAERLGPFVEAVAQARSARLETPETLRGTAVAPLIDALLTRHDDGRWTALLPVQPAGDVLDIAAVRSALAGLPQTHVLEVGPELKRLYQRYLREARNHALLGVLGVIAIVAWSLRSLRRVLAVCRPLLLAVLITLGGLAELDVQLGILHLVGLLLVVAVGSNYALFFDLLHTRDEIDDDTLASLLLANLTTVAGFGLIAMSEIPALSAIGRVVGPGALLAMVLAAAFAPRRRQAA